MSARSTIAVDVGNSAIKLGMMVPDAIDADDLSGSSAISNAPANPGEGNAVSRGAEQAEYSGSLTLSRVGLNEKDWPGLLRRAVQVWREEMQLDTASHWVISSVNRLASTELRETVAAHWPEDSWHTLSADQLPIDSTVENRNAVGLDRLLGAIGALSLFQTDDAIVVDAGSAVTIDLVKDRCFTGGAILPGIRLQLDALNHGTDQLPALEAYSRLTMSGSEASLELPGRTTREAMRSGVLIGLAGAIDRLIFQFGELCRSTPEIVFTGGDGGLLYELVKHKGQLQEDLVVTTILSVARHLEVH